MPELYASANGDRWDLLHDPASGCRFVRHTANPSSGGHITDTGLSAFLAGDRGAPEHRALRQVLGPDCGAEPMPSMVER